MNASTQLWLDQIHPDDSHRVAGITVAPAQVVFSGTVQEAFNAAEEGVDFHGIFLIGTAFGFFKIDRLYPDRYPFAKAGEVGLRAFMIDLAHQGRGLATQAVRALPAHVREQYPDATGIVLTVNKSNPAAIRAYLKGGFQNGGQEWPHGDAGPQHVLRLSL